MRFISKSVRNPGRPWVFVRVHLVSFPSNIIVAFNNLSLIFLKIKVVRYQKCFDVFKRIDEKTLTVPYMALFFNPLRAQPPAKRPPIMKQDGKISNHIPILKSYFLTLFLKKQKTLFTKWLQQETPKLRIRKEPFITESSLLYSRYRVLKSCNAVKTISKTKFKNKTREVSRKLFLHIFAAKILHFHNHGNDYQWFKRNCFDKWTQIHTFTSKTFRINWWKK